jgi:hypothetical protein
MSTDPENRKSPLRATDAEGIGLAKGLISKANNGVLGVLDPASGFPMTSRIAVARDADGTPVTLISELSHHTGALKADPRCSLLLGAPGPKGDPLTHSRITLQARARFVTRADAGFVALRDRYLAQYPKAKLYIDFLDFSFARLEVIAGHLNGGFGKAYLLSPDEMGLPHPG